MSAIDGSGKCGEYLLDFFKSTEMVFRLFVQGMEESNKKRPPFLRKMARNGWYLSPEFPIPAIEKIAVGLQNNRAEAENQLCDYFENRINKIDEYIKTHYSHRHDIVAEAFWAHRQHKFGVAIPVFLAQAEGMCSDTFGEKLYAKKSGKPAVAKKLSNFLPGTFWHNVVLQMIELFPIAENDSSVQPGQINRHQIMHGKDCAYGTRLNSCKAISLIDYVSWVCDVVKPS